MRWISSCGSARKPCDLLNLFNLAPRKSHDRLAVYSDFDGTIALDDVTDLLLERLAAPQWREIEADWQDGKMGSRECMARQIPLIRGGWKAVEEVLAEVRLDPRFHGFSQWCANNGIPLYVVSDGLDRVINFLLKREGISTEGVSANRLNINSDGSMFLTFPSAALTANCTSGLCKCRVIGPHRTQTRRIVIGDGQSDFCWAAFADVVFAKSKLLAYCRSNHIPSVEFDNFGTVHLELRQMLANLAATTVEDELEVAELHEAFGASLSF